MGMGMAKATGELKLAYSLAEFKKAQEPSSWFLSAERLRDAAEIILGDRVKQEVPFFRAADEARTKAVAAASTAADGTAFAQFACEPPNYRPGQLLYAFAMENALKG